MWPCVRVRVRRRELLSRAPPLLASCCPQVESDIAPYKGLLMGLFFMSVGMEISVQLFIQKWKEVLAAITVLIVGKVAVMGAVGPLFGLSRLAAVRSGLLLAPGGEFAFVAFGEAVSRGVLPAATCNLLYLVGEARGWLGGHAFSKSGHNCDGWVTPEDEGCLGKATRAWEVG